ncbi:MAG: hypothetical protein V2A69_14465 [Pseudomonadota bacterium]
MNYEDFMDIVRRRRSIRSYKPDPISDEEIIKKYCRFKNLNKKRVP